MTMQNQRFISTVDHVVEHPEVWTQRLAKSKWGDRIPHMERSSQDCDSWVVDGRETPLSERRSSGRIDDRPDGSAKALGRRAAESLRSDGATDDDGY